MKEIPTIKNTWGDIYQFMRMNVEGNILVSAIQRKIFDHLAEPVSGNAVAEKLKSHPRNTELFLNALAGMRLIHKKNGLFYNSTKSMEFLTSTSPAYLGAFFCRVRNWYTRCQSPEHMEDLIINGPGKTTEKRDDAIWASYTRQASAHQFCGPAQKIAELVSSLPEFPDMRKMLDLGGGGGFYTMLIVAAHKTMKGVVFELPRVASITREFIQEYGAGERVSAMEGDYLKDPLGDSYDLIFAGGTLHFAKNHMDEIFRKIYTALNPGGLFISQHGSVSHERTQPGWQISDFLLDELSGMDLIFPKGMIAGTMHQCGFKSVQTLVYKSEFGDLDIDIAKK